MAGDEAGRLLPAPAFAGFGAPADFGRGVRLQTGVRNLVDRDYFLAEGDPEPGRIGYLNLRYRFRALLAEALQSGIR